MSKIKIAVDDGHGIDTKGKQTPDGYKENEFNHWTKELLVNELIRNGFEVIDCSPNRLDNSLSNRVSIANKALANIFISIHFNALKGIWGAWGGIETFCYQFGYQSEKIARLVHKYLLLGTKLKDRKVKSANFYVLRNTKMPAILCECGFMDNKKEAELMKSDLYRKECAIEICKGICEYYKKSYIAEKNIGFTLSKQAEKILKNPEITKYSSVWIDFIHKHPEVNLSGLIENLYFHDDYKSKYIKAIEFIKKVYGDLKSFINE